MPVRIEPKKCQKVVVKKKEALVIQVSPKKPEKDLDEEAEP